MQYAGSAFQPNNSMPMTMQVSGVFDAAAKTAIRPRTAKSGIEA
jgi:hypothetical protein